MWIVYVCNNILDNPVVARYLVQYASSSEEAIRKLDYGQTRQNEYLRAEKVQFDENDVSKMS